MKPLRGKNPPAPLATQGALCDPGLAVVTMFSYPEGAGPPPPLPAFAETRFAAPGAAVAAAAASRTLHPGFVAGPSLCRFRLSGVMRHPADIISCRVPKVRKRVWQILERA